MFRALGFLLLLTLGSASHAASLPEPGTYRGHTVYRDLAYGPDKRQRLDIYLPDKPSQAKAIILRIANADPRVKADPAPWVRVTNLGDSSVDLTARVWCEAADYWELKFAMTQAVKEAFDAEGISIPYPHWVEVRRDA